MVLIREQLGCFNEVLTIVSMLSILSVFFRPKDRAEESDVAREKVFVPESEEYLFNQKCIRLALVNIPLIL